MMRIIPGLMSYLNQGVQTMAKTEMQMKNITVKKKNTERNQLIKDIKLSPWKSLTRP